MLLNSTVIWYFIGIWIALGGFIAVIYYYIIMIYIWAWYSDIVSFNVIVIFCWKTCCALSQTYRVSAWFVVS